MPQHSRTIQEKNVFEAILARRSVRSYTGEPLSHTTIQTLLEAAVHAPTAMHEEPWAFAVMQNREILEQASDLARPLFLEKLHRSRPAGATAPSAASAQDADLFHGAGTLIVICSKIAGPFVEADCWLAAQNLMLAACATGLGSCVIGSALEALNAPEMKLKFGIPDEYRAIAPIAVGVPLGETAATPRKEPLVLAWR